MIDLRIVGGTVIDGTGAPRRQADVGIDSGRIVSVDEDSGPARRTLSAEGMVVAPGFVDSHTHLDAQLAWDPLATPSTLHGVTTVLGGNCGFSIAPLQPDATDYVRRMLARVEGIPLEALESGPEWEWTSFGQWLDRFDGRIAVNAGFAVGHSTLRYLAMGPAAVGGKPTEAQSADMARRLHQALDDGALGFTSSLASSHSDGNGLPVPSRATESAELVGLAAALRDHPGTSLGLNPGAGPFASGMMDTMADMSREADRVLNWNALLIYQQRWDEAVQELAASDHATARGGHVVAEVVPDPRRFYVSFLSGFLLDALPGWAELFSLPLAERQAWLADRGRRQALLAGVVSDAVPAMLRNHTDPSRMTVVQTADPATGTLAGRRVEDIAKERGISAFDCFLDIAVEDGLGAVFMPDPVGDDDRSWELRGAAMTDPRTVIGAADSGAHLDVASSFNYTTSVLAGSVRRRGLFSLETAIRELTDVPARLFGVTGRGRIRPGWGADLVLFDPDTVGPMPEEIRTDLPGGARRIYAAARGIAAVLVNGEPIVEHGEHTGQLPGTVLRSGRDTETVTVAGAQALSTSATGH
ncbi:MAG TPA: amidohydrolase family protein [Acidimicrobiales bacterium]|nr:amidohydrolase family protein [Acidimicrobiales bacterium]